MNKLNTSNHPTDRPNSSGLTNDFSDITNDEVQDTHEFEHKIALSFPCEDRKDSFRLQFILDHFEHIGIVTGGSRTRNLVSHYFDTPKGNLYAQGLALRTRYEEDPKTGVTLTRPDVSIKNKGHDVGGTTLRDEYEAKLELFENGTTKPILDTGPLVKEYGSKWREDITQDMSLDFEDYREVFSINCRRTTFKVCLYACARADGTTRIKTENELTAEQRKQNRRMVYEFALDANRFFVPSQTKKLAKDYEIEFELKTHDCDYDPNPDSSDDGVTFEEAMAGRDMLRDHVDALLEQRKLRPMAMTGLSKSERGENYRRDAGYIEPCLDKLTMRGRTNSFYLAKSFDGNGYASANDNLSKSNKRNVLRPQTGAKKSHTKKLHFPSHK